MNKLCIGPMSKNVVDVIIENDFPVTLIPSRRQIDYNGGYVNNWTTETFSKYVKSRNPNIKIQRDHGGPNQGDSDFNISLIEDMYFFNSIHYDPFKSVGSMDNIYLHMISILDLYYERFPEVLFEMGTEEAICKMDNFDLECMLNDLKQELTPQQFDNIKTVVIQSGTKLFKTTNIGKYDRQRLIDQVAICKKYGKLSKEHNGDYITDEEMKDRFKNGLDSINVAPEFGNLETKTIIEHLDKKRIDEWFDICYLSKRWEKWVNKDYLPYKNKRETIEICGHYTFSDPRFIKLMKGINITEIIKDRIKKQIERLLKNVNQTY